MSARGERAPGAPIVVAIAGRPNAGKSTLFNRLLRRQKAIVYDTPGVTRDENRGTLRRDGRVFEIVDTGGIEEQADAGHLAGRVHARSLATIAHADQIVYVLDGRAGLSPADVAVARRIRQLGIPAIFAVNKIDRGNQESRTIDFLELGEADLVPVSAAHGLGVDELWRRIDQAFPPRPDAADEGEAEADGVAADGDAAEAGAAADSRAPTRIALVGRPNVGKSSLLNRLVGFERALVDATPGTTRDAVDVRIEHAGREYVVVDTAGLRRPSRIDEPIESYAAGASLRALMRTEVAILVLDAKVGVTDQDMRLADLAWRKGRGLVVAVNKADLAPELAAEQCHDTIARRLPQWPPLPVLRVSAQEGTGIWNLFAAVDTVVASFRRRVPTARLNDVVRAAIDVQAPPTEHGRVVKLYYATQASASPPHVVLFGSQREKLPQSWIRFLTHRLRDEFALVGVPLKVSARQREGRREEPAPGATAPARPGAKPRAGRAAKPKVRIPVPRKPKPGIPPGPHRKRVAAKKKPAPPRAKKPRR
ncbi:MAG: ribosome biogenesis GTPase Der [Deltaproteobacteria bacterium]|nr:ribosome biogenesis GTPase Der [Deltaproteobacteria bacterium]